MHAHVCAHACRCVCTCTTTHTCTHTTIYSGSQTPQCLPLPTTKRHSWSPAAHSPSLSTTLRSTQSNPCTSPSCFKSLSLSPRCAYNVNTMQIPVPLHCLGETSTHVQYRSNLFFCWFFFFFQIFSAICLCRTHAYQGQLEWNVSRSRGAAPELLAPPTEGLLPEHSLVWAQGLVRSWHPLHFSWAGGVAPASPAPTYPIG